jgi:hypothetical protein
MAGLPVDCPAELAVEFVDANIAEVDVPGVEGAAVEVVAATAHTPVNMTVELISHWTWVMTPRSTASNRLSC